MRIKVMSRLCLAEVLGQRCAREGSVKKLRMQLGHRVQQAGAMRVASSQGLVPVLNCLRSLRS